VERMLIVPVSNKFQTVVQVQIEPQAVQLIIKTDMLIVTSYFIAANGSQWGC
jgi:hypothetical protein